MRRLARRAAIATAVILGLGLSGVMCQRVSARGRYVAAYSTYGSGPEGTRGLYLLAEQIGARPQRWAEDLGRLPEGGGMLVALGACETWMRRDVGRLERENLKAWIEAGGVLLVAGAPDYVRRSDFGVAIDGGCERSSGLIRMLEEREGGPRKESDGDDEPQLEDLPGMLREEPERAYDEVVDDGDIPMAHGAWPAGEPVIGLPWVGLRQPRGVRFDESRSHHTLLRLDGPEGEPVGVRVDVGEGAVIALGSASMFQNRDLSQQNGGLLFARLVREHAGGGPVLFDEYHLGIGQHRGMMRYLRQAGLGAFIVQLLLLVLFVIWRFGARFGSPRDPAPPEPAGTASYVEGVGTLYAKAKDPVGAAGILVRRALERIAAHHHVDAKGAAPLADTLEARKRKEAAEAVRAIATLESEAAAHGLPRFTERLDAELARAIS